MTKPFQGNAKIWRVFYTRPRAEKKCQIQLMENDVEVFLPVRTVIRQWADRKKKVVEPLFTSYIFARVDERERIRVLEMDGIIRAVSFDGKAAIVPETEIEQLKILQAAPEGLEAVAMRAYPEGTEILVTSGPLKGLKGRVIGKRGPIKLLVEVPSISQGVKLQIPANWVDTIPSRP